jgi:hypothetical protein
MSSGLNTTSTSRLSLKPAAPTTGHVDGAWWPRTRDLAAELPALLAAVADRLGRIDRVTYHLADWPASQRRIVVGGNVVRLEGFRSQEPGSLTVIGWDRNRLTVQVIPPETGPDAAQRVLTRAAEPTEGGVPLPA